jgi:hypothetical protein
VVPEESSKDDLALLDQLKAHKSALEDRSVELDNSLAKLKAMDDSSPNRIEAVIDVKITIGEANLAGLKELTETAGKIDEMIYNLQKHKREMVESLGKDFVDRAFACSQETKDNLLETKFVVMELKDASEDRLMALEMLQEEGRPMAQQLELAESVFNGRSDWEERSRKVRELQRLWEKTQKKANALQTELVTMKVEDKAAEEAKKKKRSFWSKLWSGVKTIIAVTAVGFLGAVGAVALGIPCGLGMSIALLVGAISTKKVQRVAKKVFKEAVDIMERSLKTMSDLANRCFEMLALVLTAVTSAMRILKDKKQSDAPAAALVVGERAFTTAEEKFMRQCKGRYGKMEEHLKKVIEELDALLDELAKYLFAK